LKDEMNHLHVSVLDARKFCQEKFH
jgi:hypothetical protein